MKKVLTHVVGLAIAGLMWVGLYLNGQNAFIDSLVAVGTWLVLILSWLITIFMIGGAVVLNVTTDKEIVQKSDPNQYKYRWWTALLAIMWVVMFAYAGWVAAAVLYALSTFLSWVGMALIRHAVLEAQKP